MDSNSINSHIWIVKTILQPHHRLLSLSFLIQFILHHHLKLKWRRSLPPPSDPRRYSLSPSTAASRPPRHLRPAFSSVKWETSSPLSIIYFQIESARRMHSCLTEARTAAEAVPWRQEPREQHLMEAERLPGLAADGRNGRTRGEPEGLHCSQVDLASQRWSHEERLWVGTNCLFFPIYSQMTIDRVDLICRYHVHHVHRLGLLFLWIH